MNNGCDKGIGTIGEKNIINRYSSGVFYKPKQTAFGTLKSNEEELLKTICLKMVNGLSTLQD